jgi:hypothetical protein
MVRGSAIYLLVERFGARDVFRISKINVPKENFSLRPAMVLHPIDRLAYQALVDGVSATLIGDLKHWVFGWRLGRAQPKRGEYSSSDLEWGSYRARLQWMTSEYGRGLLTDIVSYFASIEVPILCEMITSRAHNDLTKRLNDMLLAWAKVPGRSGIPQRCSASSVLANLYLRPLDDAIRSVATFGEDGEPSVARWMDDIWVLGGTRGDLRAAQIRLEAEMRDLGLNMGTGKTVILEGSDLAEAAYALEHGSVDAGLRDEPPNTERLVSLVDRLVSDPEGAARTTIHFATTRIRQSQQWDLAQKLSNVADQMPHGSDHLARLFRDSELWPEMATWYAEYGVSSWGKVDWSVGQLGTMFPVSRPGPQEVVDFFERIVAETHELPLLAVAAHRLAAWRPDQAREVLRARARDASDPLKRRVFTLAGLMAGEERELVRRSLAEFPDNRVTLLALEDTHFRPPSVPRDFSG